MPMNRFGSVLIFASITLTSSVSLSMPKEYDPFNLPEDVSRYTLMNQSMLSLYNPQYVQYWMSVNSDQAFERLKNGEPFYEDSGAIRSETTDTAVQTVPDGLSIEDISEFQRFGGKVSANLLLPGFLKSKYKLGHQMIPDCYLFLKRGYQADFLDYTDFDLSVVDDENLSEALAVLARVHAKGDYHLNETDPCRIDFRKHRVAEIHPTTMLKFWIDNQGRLKNADLSDLNLKNLDFGSTDLENTLFFGSNLKGANLSWAKGLTFERVSKAKNWQKAKLPPYLKVPFKDRLNSLLK